MEYEFARYGPSVAALTMPPSPHYYLNARNMPLDISSALRFDPRGGGGPVGGQHNRTYPIRDDATTESGQARRRIAVACARCRKRKIRCSGDPGNGSGCHNCRASGVDLSQCQFHRVGSSNATDLITNMNVAQSLASMTQQNAMINAASNAMFQRALMAHQHPALNTRSTYQTWAIPGSEDTSPVEQYGLGSTTAYLSNQDSMANVYGHNYRYQVNQKALRSASTPYLDQDSYPSSSHPCVSASLRNVVLNEPTSPLSMSSLQCNLPLTSTLAALTLPERPHPRQSQALVATAPQRQLPRPQPNPTQTSRNVVDQLQDQRLRSPQLMNGISYATNTVGDAKPSVAWNLETTPAELQDGPVTETTAANLVLQTNSSKDYARPTTPPDDTIAYVPVTSSSSNGDTTATSAPQELNFSTAPLFEPLSTPTPSVTYSNFRNYSLPTSSSAESLNVLARQASQTNLYSFSAESSSKRTSLDDLASEAVLVSGQRYAPLGEPPAQPQTSRVDNFRRESFEVRVPCQRASMSNPNRIF
ncbi:hypothetical protein BCR34DRAFT_161378 [Clohesyomyces aquaticus]|uniref:Zn(2)-C6 fungal-type domain-containing protein n=1 Tax=Clohesyomyces aquaticus TaxID=1231657 RepID=A0A1Y2A0X9_9PLEO|nr:hypothetical protein BCR34DRAFT_161378 [Clohesyomyces aquaticus]